MKDCDYFYIDPNRIKVDCNISSPDELDLFTLSFTKLCSNFTLVEEETSDICYQKHHYPAIGKLYKVYSRRGGDTQRNMA